MQQLAHGPTESLETWRSLRRRTPTQFARDRVAAYDRDVQWSSDLRIDRAALDALDKLPLLVSPAPDSKIVMAADAADADRIYLERIATVSQADSGWFIGSAEPTARKKYAAVRAADLLAARPDFGPILALPVGTLVIIERSAIRAILNADDELLLGGL